MDLDKDIDLTYKGKSFNLPLVNLLRLAMIYLRPFIDEYLSILGKQDIKTYSIYRNTWDNLYKAIMNKLGVEIGKGDSVLL